VQQIGGLPVALHRHGGHGTLERELHELDANLVGELAGASLFEPAKRIHRVVGHSRL
jgi:hypothetical protein